MTGVQQMEIIFHTGKDSEQSLRQFAEKRAEFLSRELRDLNAEELKALSTHSPACKKNIPTITGSFWRTGLPA